MISLTYGPTQTQNSDVALWESRGHLCWEERPSMYIPRRGRIPGVFPAHQQKERERKPLLGTSYRKNSCSGQASWGSVGFPKCNLASSVMVSPQRCEPWWPGFPLASSTKPSHCGLIRRSQQSCREPRHCHHLQTSEPKLLEVTWRGQELN